MLRQAIGAAANLLYPPSIYCVSCGNLIDDSRPYAVCDRCRNEIDWRLGELPTGHDFRRGYYCATYSGWVKNIVRDMKYHDKPYIAENIAEIMADRAYGDEEIMGADLIIPTPMFAAKKRKRGYNQAELIAARLAELTGIEYAPDILVKNHQTEALSTKNRDERALLLSGAFSADGEKLCVSEFYGNISQDISSLNSQPRNGKSARVLLIDDVFTTGATSNACARALYSAGAATVDLFVFATGAAN